MTDQYKKYDRLVHKFQTVTRNRQTGTRNRWTGTRNRQTGTKITDFQEIDRLEQEIKRHILIGIPAVMFDRRKDVSSMTYSIKDIHLLVYEIDRLIYEIDRLV